MSWHNNNPFKKEKKKPKDLKEAKFNAEIAKLGLSYNGDSYLGLISAFDEPISLKTRKLEFIFPSYNFFTTKTITLRYSSTSLDLYSDSEIENDYQYLWSKPFGSEEITIMEDSLDESMLDLINEFIGCYRNKYYLASCCLAREMIYEIAKMFNIKIMKTEKRAFGFRETLENIEKEVPFIQKDHDFWITLLDSASGVVHYKHKNSSDIADTATQGIIKIFNYINTRRLIK